jgi:hypothetical protein
MMELFGEIEEVNQIIEVFQPSRHLPAGESVKSQMLAEMSKIRDGNAPGTGLPAIGPFELGTQVGKQPPHRALKFPPEPVDHIESEGVNPWYHHGNEEEPVRGFTRYVFSAFLLLAAPRASAEEPCDRYPESRQKRCEMLWKQINAETGPEVAQFGLDQLKRRQDGKLTAEQHLQENMAFIKKHAEKRVRLLEQRMDKQ